MKSLGPTAVQEVVYRWDLDKTYLRTDFESLRELIRVPFETAHDKVDVPGVAELIPRLRSHAGEHGARAFVYFLSASPPQIARAIREKLELDGIVIDGIVFKDQLQILMRGKLRGLREQMGFKLTELFRGRIDAPSGSVEYLFGDDWETDPLIYSLYADALAGRIEAKELGELLSRVPVDGAWISQITDLLGRVPPGDVVRRIFINLERQTPPGLFHAFGPRLVPTFNYFQTAACLFEEGRLDAAGVDRVGRALITRESYSRRMLENSLGDLSRRGHLGDAAHEELTATLRRWELLPAGRRTLRERWRSWRRRRTVPLAPPALAPVPDYAALVAARRTER